MAHAHVLREGWKKFEITKVWNNFLACHRGCAWWEHSCVTKMEHDQTIWFCRGELSLAMIFWEDMITLLVCLNYYYFYVNIKLLSWIFRIWIFIPQLRRITLKLWQVAFHIKNSVFYHLPTRGRAGIKLGDAWYISNVSIIFDCFMLYYILFWM